LRASDFPVQFVGLASLVFYTTGFSYCALFLHQKEKARFANIYTTWNYAIGAKEKEHTWPSKHGEIQWPCKKGRYALLSTKKQRERPRKQQARQASRRAQNKL
jgi:hypothetical protein